MLKERKYYTDVMKRHFNKELAMTTTDNEDFGSSGKCWICDNDYVDDDVNVIDNCRITGKYRGSAHRDFHIKVELNDKVSILFHNLNNYDSHLTVQELSKFHFKINVISDRPEMHISFNISNTLIFTDSFQF